MEGLEKGYPSEVVDWDAAYKGQLNIPDYLVRKFKEQGFELVWVNKKNVDRKKDLGCIPLENKEADNRYPGYDGMAAYGDLRLCKRRISIGESKKKYLEKRNRDVEASISQESFEDSIISQGAKPIGQVTATKQTIQSTKKSGRPAKR